MPKICIWLVCIGCAFIVLGAVMSPHDDTDAPDRRSGMVLYTDAATGCQYLGNPRGGITPRLTPSGKHSGCR
jgi:hypothetical protein